MLLPNKRVKLADGGPRHNPPDEMVPMNRQDQYEKYSSYIESEGLDRLLNFKENEAYKDGVFDAVSGKLSIPVPPQPDDCGTKLHKEL